MSIQKSLTTVKQRIADAAICVGRQPADIQLVAVSKTKPAEMVRAAYQAGQSAFGENYLQDALKKITELSDLPLEWHYIGKLQSNKCKEIAQHFAWVHGIDQLKHAHLLSRYRPAGAMPIHVCIQVNLSGESSKNGVEPAQTLALAKSIAELPQIKLRGLMTMPNPNASEQEQSSIFQGLAELKKQLNQRGLCLDTLSIGMSGDLALAVAAGSTMVRVGTDIFGARQ